MKKNLFQEYEINKQSLENQKYRIYFIYAFLYGLFHCP